MLRENLPEDLSLRLEMARTDYLYGMPGESPCMNAEKLARKYGLNVVVITRHVRAWMAELEAWAISNSKTYCRGSDPQVQMEHENDVAFLRKQVDALQRELADPKLKVGGETYKFIFDQWTKAQKRYSELSGAEAALNITNKVQEQAASAAMEDHIERRRNQEAAKELEAGNKQLRVVDSDTFDIGTENVA